MPAPTTASPCLPQPPPPPSSGARSQLTHRSFATPKWLEYALALLGTCGLEMVRGWLWVDSWAAIW